MTNHRNVTTNAKDFFWHLFFFKPIFFCFLFCLRPNFFQFVLISQYIILIKYLCFNFVCNVSFIFFNSEKETIFFYLKSYTLQKSSEICRFTRLKVSMCVYFTTEQKLQHKWVSINATYIFLILPVQDFLVLYRKEKLE